MKVFISADIEGVNSICSWDETEYGHQRYHEFKRQMTEEVKMACMGAKEARATTILVKDAHDSAMNLSISDLPQDVMLHRGWEGNLCSMMAGLDSSFDAVLFVGYHSPSRSAGNPLSHTMSTQLVHIKINGEIVSEFYINALYATMLGVPVYFLSGDQALTQTVKHINPKIDTVATKVGFNGGVMSKHPSVTNQEIFDTVKKSLQRSIDHKPQCVAMPTHFDVEIQYRTPKRAYSAAFYPGCTLSPHADDTILFQSNSYEDVLRMFHFNL